MKKILFVATVPEHFLYFHIPCFEMLRKNGWEVHVACSGDVEIPCCDRRFSVPMVRNPFDKSNKEALRQLKKIIADTNYDIVHCHTPVGGALARIAAKKWRRRGTKVIYTAHGFHFCKGAPLINWLLYLPAENLLSYITDELITINDEDYLRASTLLHAKHVSLVHGVGCDIAKYGRAGNEEKSELRRKLGYSDDDIILFYAAELNKNKNQKFLIETVKRLQPEFPKIRLLLAGQDNFGGEYQRLAQQLDAPVDFLGVRDDIPELLKIADLYAASSLREGLPLNIMEAMASGLPVVAVSNRGHRALVSQGVTGFLVAPGRTDLAAEKIRLYLTDSERYNNSSFYALEKIKPYSKENVLEELGKIYFADDKKADDGAAISD